MARDRGHCRDSLGTRRGHCFVRPSWTLALARDCEESMLKGLRDPALTWRILEPERLPWLDWTALGGPPRVRRDAGLIDWCWLRHYRKEQCWRGAIDVGCTSGAREDGFQATGTSCGETPTLEGHTKNIQKGEQQSTNLFRSKFKLKRGRNKHD